MIAAGLAYLGVLGCVLWPQGSRSWSSPRADAQTTRQGPLTGLPYRSIGMQIQRVDWIDKYKKSIDEIAQVGADTVLLVVDARQENSGSSRIYLDMRMTPDPQRLGELIDHAKSKGLRVILMPIVLLDEPRKPEEWRGTLAPESWEDWFDSYRAMICHFSWIAQGHGVDVLVVGSELVSSQTHVKEWSKTIGEIRGIFKGQLTYSSNWDRYDAVPFWDELDLIGMNSYWKLGSDHTVSIEQIEQSWRQEIQPDLLKFLNKMHKPLIFLEVGWCSLANAAHESWDYTREEVPIDLDLQRKLYEGFFRSWQGNPALGGFSIWEWTPGDGGKDNRGYTPENKPAEKVLREWLKKPRWDVR
jgi:hypothetical protein